MPIWFFFISQLIEERWQSVSHYILHHCFVKNHTMLTHEDFLWNITHRNRDKKSRRNDLFGFASKQVLTSSIVSLTYTYHFPRFIFVQHRSCRILLRYCESLLYKALICQDTSYETSYVIYSKENSTEVSYMNNFCSVLYFISEHYISQHCELYLCVSQGQPTMLQVALPRRLIWKALRTGLWEHFAYS